MRNVLLVLVLLVGLTGCAKVTYEEAMAKYGPIPSDYEEQVKEQVIPQLKDPNSARFTFPSGGCYSGRSLTGPGWGVYFYVNAKNSFGGYTGNQDWACSIMNGKVGHCRRFFDGYVVSACSQ